MNTSIFTYITTAVNAASSAMQQFIQQPLFGCLLSCFALSCIFSIALMQFARRFKLFQPEREEILAITKMNKFVPTMGGIAILLAIHLVFWFYPHGYSKSDWDVLLLGTLFAILGFADDFLKLKRAKYSGLLVKTRLFVEILLAGIFVYSVLQNDAARCYIPLIKICAFPMVMIWGMFMILSGANSYNLTDGVDSLAATLGGYVMLFLWLVNDNFLALLGLCGLLGYLVLNRPPAKLIMGDTGALGIGAMIGAFFFKHHLDLLLPIVGIVFVLETVSVIIQIYYIRALKKRFFLMAPLHHHFQKSGWSKGKILLVFNTIGILALIIACIIERLI